VALVALAMVVPILSIGRSDAADLHGITFLKGCNSPTMVGDKTLCNFTIANSSDPDTLTITSIVDTVHASGGDDVSANILPSLVVSFTGGAGCDAVQATCTLPKGSKIQTSSPFAFHTVTGADFTNKNPLVDDADLTWQDTCDSHSPNCPVGDQHASTGSQTALQKRPSSTSTLIHNASHQVVTAIEAGTTVHDFVTVTGGAGNPVPTGGVNVKWFTNNTCTGSPQSNSGNVQLVNGSVDVTSFAKTPGAGQFAFQAHYNGSSTYRVSDGECEPLTVVDASIGIAPDATNEVGKNHTFTVTVRQNDGTGWTRAAGATVDYTLTNSNGATEHTSPNPPTTCDGTTNGNGQCKIVFESPTAGQVTGNASVTLTLAGISVTRSTSGNSGPTGTGPAVKTYVDASIGITPNAVNEVNQDHTFNVVVKQNTGDGSGFVAVPDNTKPTVTLANFNGALAVPSSNTCLNPGTVNGTCSITFTSATAGYVTGNASVTLVVGGVTLTRDTNAATSAIPSGPGGTGQARKDFVDANISIGPDGTNPVNVNHTFTVTVQRNLGLGAGFVNVPDFTKPVVTLTDSGGATHTTSDDNCATVGTINGKCSVTFSSPTVGTTIGNAMVTLTIRGVTVIRDTAGNSGPGGSGPATKHWVNVPSSGQILPTQTTCQDYLNGAQSLPGVFYGVKSGTINNAEPGVLFYYNKFEAPSSTFDVHVTQTITSGNFSKLFGTKQVMFYDADCNTLSMTVTSTAPGDVVFHVTGATAGATYVLSVKYSPHDVAGQPAPTPTTVHYAWAMDFNGGASLPGSDAAIDMTKKP
jgi:hypothetical protein